ncbi:PhzF family phenazine biosynthesis protein [Amycolatopsis sp. NPDC003861]
MAAIARWTNLAETTFLLTPSHASADYRLRIFTISRELPFAGHATLGAARAWLAAGNTPRRAGRIEQECGAGQVRIRSDVDLLWFAAPPLLRDAPPGCASNRNRSRRPDGPTTAPDGLSSCSLPRKLSSRSPRLRTFERILRRRRRRAAPSGK